MSAERAVMTVSQLTERLRAVVEQGGFRRFRRATETPVNLILEARP